MHLGLTSTHVRAARDALQHRLRFLPEARSYVWWNDFRCTGEEEAAEVLREAAKEVAAISD
jgi:hypothetical protein